jgi:signal transduction histidine kinase
LEDGVVSDPQTIARYHRTLRQETERLSHLVDDLFELSVIHAGGLRLEVERMPLGDLVSDAIASAAPSALARGVRVDGELLGEAPIVEVSAAELGRLLGNLLGNAIRFTRRGGVICVRAGRDDGAAFVSVADECGGIPAEDLGRLFEPAFRGQRARARAEGGGAGLGLAIARGIAEAHHGHLTVRNGTGGCCFTLRLPIAPEANGATASSRSSLSSRSGDPAARSFPRRP